MKDSRLMKRYLLGTATPAERTALENEYLANAETFHELKAAENDLIDSYTRGTMVDAEKRDFEKLYLTSTQGRSRVEFARALGDIAKEEAFTAPVHEASLFKKIFVVFSVGTISPAWRFAAACAIVLIVGLVSFRILNHHGSNVGPSEASKHFDRPPSNHQPGPAEQSSQSPAGTESTTGAPPLMAKNEAQAPQDYNAQLEPDAVRAIGSGLQALVVPAHTRWLNLRIAVDDEAGPLTAVVQTPEGTEVFRHEHAEITNTKRGKFLDVRIPAGRIAAGDYILEVTSEASGSKTEESVTSCSFRLTYK